MMPDSKTSFELAFRRTVARISLGLLKVNDQAAFDAEIDGALAELGSLFSVDRSSLFRYSKDLSLGSNTHEWCAPGIPAKKEHYQNVPADSMRWWRARMMELRPLHVPEVAALPAEAAAEKAALEAHGVRSLLVMPFSGDSHRLLGFVSFDALRAPRVWPDEHIEMMAVLAEIIGTAVNRMEAAASLAESESKFRTLHRSMMDAFAGVDLEGRIVEHNESFLTMLGYTAEEVGKFTYKDITPEKWHAFEDAIVEKQVLPNGYSEIYEKEYRRKDGTVFPVELRTTLIRDAKGLPMRMLAIVRDITERRRVEREIRYNEARYRAFISKTSEGVWCWEVNEPFPLDLPEDEQLRRVMQGRISEANDAVAKQYGFSRAEEMIGRSFGEFIAEEEFLGLSSLLVAARYNVSNVESVEADNAGNRRFFINNSVGIVEDGLLVRIWGTQRDVTDLKMIEESMQRSQRLESLGLLAGGIAHDFNNLMGGIFGYVDLAIAETDKGRCSEYLSMAMSTIDRARALTGQLLAFAKGGAPIQKVGHLLPFIEEAAKFALSGSNVSCRFDVPQDLWPCNFDKNQIGQVIDNLVINAQQAMPLGGTIELSARNVVLAEREHPTLTAGQYVKLSVRDSGVGIPREHIPRIFDPFYTTKSKGQGLGLATCYFVINRHGGCIDVESETGKGSVFHVYLPASPGPVSSSTEEPTTLHRGAGAFLVMDDEAVVREALHEILSSFGYAVVCKENGKDAVEFFAAEVKADRKIVGIIFDLTVPGGMGGKEAVAEIRKLDKEIPVLVASGYAEDPVLKNPADYGFTASICKPFRIAELSELLNRCLKSPN